MTAKENLADEPTYLASFASVQNMIDGVMERNMYIESLNEAIEQYESDMADFQSNLVSKSKNLLDSKYYKSDPIEYKYIQQKMPVFTPDIYSFLYIDVIGAFGTIDTFFEHHDDQYKYTMTMGFGKNTGGTLMAKTGYVKAFGTQGMSMDAMNKGYKHPADAEGSCSDTFVAVFVVPTNRDFEQTPDDTLTITIESEDAMEVDLMHEEIDTDSLMFKLATNDMIAEGYTQYAQDQELAEFLGAKYIAGAAASAATLAAMTLF